MQPGAELAEEIVSGTNDFTSEARKVKDDGAVSLSD
jgi:hypothetical protein